MPWFHSTALRVPRSLPPCYLCSRQIFGKLMEAVDEAELSAEEAKERKIMKLLLKVKNGTPPQRKSALRQLTEKARDFGAKALFDQILPLLMTPTLEDQERHLLVKVIDRCGRRTVLACICPGSICCSYCRLAFAICSCSPPLQLLEWRNKSGNSGMLLHALCSLPLCSPPGAASPPSQPNPGSCISWTSWCGRTCTRSWWSSSRC